MLNFRTGVSCDCRPDEFGHPQNQGQDWIETVFRDFSKFDKINKHIFRE
jgi:hypothetical protein